MRTTFPSQARCERAADLLAEMTVFTFRDPEQDAEKRTLVARNLTLACSLCIEPNENLGLDIYKRLVTAGAHRGGATTLVTRLTHPTEIRKTFALTHVKEDQPKFGQRVFGSSKSENPKRFVNSIIRLAKN